jgi:nicotinamide-nucleotide amidase
MPNLEIITIGTELLLGEITDTNSTYIARTLRDHGIDIYRITTIGDNTRRIAAAIKEALVRSDIIITTGGLGPTVDDPTRQAVADATERDLVFLDELWEQILDRFKVYGRVPTKNNRRQAMIPEGALPISNPVGTAPCFIVEVGSSYVISLPGVPKEMEHILHHSIIPFLKNKFHLESQIIKATVLHSAAIGESMIDQIISDLEEQSNPTVGLLAHPGQVDIRVTAKASSETEAIEMIKPLLDELHHRLGDNIYGKDEDTLEGLIADILEENRLELGIIEYGLNGRLGERVQKAQARKIKTRQLEAPLNDLEMLKSQVDQLFRKDHINIGFGLGLLENEQLIIHMVYQDSSQLASKTRGYGGPPQNAPLWALNLGLEFLRRNLVQFIGKQPRGET